VKITFGTFVREARLQKKIGLNACNVDSGKIGITQERVRQIEAKAIRKLRHPLRGHFFE
jgi:hypothetical protein